MFHTIFNVLGVVVFMPLVGWMVRFLERVIPDKTPIEAGVEQAMFINEAVGEFPDAALVALDSEIRHLGLNAIEIIARVLQLPLAEVLGTRPMSEVVGEARAYEQTNVDELYRTRMKGIYSEIVEFASKATSNMTPEQTDAVYRLRGAARDLVESVKALRLLERNLGTYMNSENDTMRAEYDRLRTHLGQMLRDIQTARETEDPDVAVALLEAVKDAMAEDDILANGRLDQLIRDHLITPEMASSLMNDSAYAYEVLTKIVTAADGLFRTRRELLSSPLEEARIDMEDDTVLDRRSELLTGLREKGDKLQSRIGELGKT